MRKAATLTERERRFVEAFMGAAAGNATTAAKMAGYSAKTARTIGSRLLTKVDIQAAVQVRVASDPTVATRERRQLFWTEVMEGKGVHAGADLKDRLKASELLGRSQRDFITDVEVSGPGGGPVRVTFGGRHRPLGKGAGARR